MTNPPFYLSSHELLVSAKGKSRPPNSVCTGAKGEMITPGGEIGFITRLINQSTHPDIKHKVQWWSSMLGKLSSVGVVVDRLKREGVRNWTVGELAQAGKTRRWVVAWSWSGLRPASGASIPKGLSRRATKAKPAVSEESETLQGGLLPFPPHFAFHIEGPNVDAVNIGRRIDTELCDLDLHWQWKASPMIGLGLARAGDCWSRKARRRKKQQSEQMESGGSQQEMDEEGESEDNREPKLAFKIRVKEEDENEEDEMTMGDGSQSNVSMVMVTVRWLQGHDAVLFESFCGWLKRKLTT